MFKCLAVQQKTQQSTDKVRTDFLYAPGTNCLGIEKNAVLYKQQKPTSNLRKMEPQTKEEGKKGLSGSKWLL